MNVEVVNGFLCRNCTDVENAKKHINPAHPKDGPYNIDAPKTGQASPGNPASGVSASGTATSGDSASGNPASGGAASGGYGFSSQAVTFGGALAGASDPPSPQTLGYTPGSTLDLAA